MWGGGTYDIYDANALHTSDITQETGDSTAAVMSQNAITNALDSKLSTTGGTMTGILYTSASTPFLIGKNGKVGMRARATDKNNVGQMNISNAWYNNGNQWGAQIAAYNGEANAYNELRVSHNGVEYNCEDGNTYQVLHSNNYSEYTVPTSRTINGKALTSDITLSATDVGADASGSADTALESAKSYTDTKISEVSAIVDGDNLILS